MFSFSYKRFFVLFISTVINISNISGQNLIDNPSFENAILCPDSLNQVYKAVGWFSTRPSPDYFNICNTDTGSSMNNVSVPSNYWGYQYPASGNAYIGLTAKSGYGNVREFIGGQLLNNLTIGKKYFVSFKASLALNNFPYLCAVNKLGILFSTQQYSISSNAPICNCSQIYSDSIISDTANWVLIKGCFISDSAYAFLNIGNFFDDLNTDSIQVIGTFSRAYYYLDDICVSEDSTLCYFTNGVNSKKPENKIFLYPNPFSKEIIIVKNYLKIEKITMIDELGRLIKFDFKSQNEKVVITPRNKTNGLIYLKIEGNNFVYNYKVLMLNN